MAYLREQSSQRRGLADGTSEVNHNSENTPSTNGKVRVHICVCVCACMRANRVAVSVCVTHLVMTIKALLGDLLLSTRLID